MRQYQLSGQPHLTTNCSPESQHFALAWNADGSDTERAQQTSTNCAKFYGWVALMRGIDRLHPSITIVYGCIPIWIIVILLGISLLMLIECIGLVTWFFSRCRSDRYLLSQYFWAVPFLLTAQNQIDLSQSVKFVVGETSSATSRDGQPWEKHLAAGHSKLAGVSNWLALEGAQITSQKGSQSPENLHTVLARWHRMAEKSQVIYVVPLQNPRARPWLHIQFSARFETTLHLFGRKPPTVQTGCFHSSSHHKSTFTFFNMEGKRYAHGINWYTKASCLPGYNLNQKILQWGEPLKWLIPTVNDTPSYKNKLGLQEGGWHPLICSTNWVIIYE